MATDPPGIAELKRLNEQLTGLLADPQPGIYTWRIALREVLLNLALFSGRGPVIQAANAELGTEAEADEAYRRR